MHGHTRRSAPVAGSQADSQADPRRWRALALLATAQFMLILDITVVSVALPDVGRDLDLGSALPWVMTAYTVCFGGLMLLGGRSADLYGARRMVLTGVTVFTAASLVAGLAGSVEVLVGARMGQGVGAAMLSPAALSVLTGLFHGDERRRALAVWGALAGTGAAVGVLAGGVLTSTVGWRWIFFVNVPVGIAVLVLLPMLIDAAPAAALRRRLDVLGALVATAATASAVYGLIRVGQDGWAGSRTVTALVAAVALYAVFVVVERRVSSPLVEIGLLTRPSMLGGAFLMVVATGLLIGGFYLGSFLLQTVRGHSALETGLLFLPIAVATIAGAHGSGQALGHLGPRPVAVAGLLVAAAGLGLAGLSDATAAAVIGTSIAAAGVGATFVAATTGALGTVSHEESGAASGLLNTFHELGSAFGVAVFSTVAGIGVSASGATPDFAQGYLTGAVAALVAAGVAAVVVPAGKLPEGVQVSLH